MNMSPTMTPELKISRAKTKLILGYPFFGCNLITTPIVEVGEEVTRTMATDGRSIFWNREFVEWCSVPQIIFTFAHEVMHILYKHPLRKKGREHVRWNKSCDYPINQILKDAGFELVDNILLDENFGNLPAEVVYNRLPPEPEKPEGGGKSSNEPFDGGSFGEVIDPRNPDGTLLSDTELGELEGEIDQKLLNSSKQIMAGNLPKEIKDMIKKLLEPKVDWRDQLLRFVQGGDNPEDFTFSRFKKSTLETVGTLMPTSDRVGVADVIVLHDQSGSMATPEHEVAFTELNEITTTLCPKSVTVIPFDTSVAEEGIRHYEQGEEIDKVELVRSGGTSITPCFNYLEEHDLVGEDTKVIVMTDMGIWDYPKGDNIPHYEVLWCNVSGSNEVAPFGDTILVKEDQR